VFPGLLVLAGGVVGGSGRGPFPCLHSLPIQSLGALTRGIRCGAARGGFLPASSGRYAVHCLADPNYTISTIAKVGIWGRRSSATSSAMFTAVCPFFGVLLLRHGSCWEYPLTYFVATPVIQSTDHIKKIFRVARTSRGSKPEAPSQCRTMPCCLNAVQRRTVSMPYNAITGNKD